MGIPTGKTQVPSYFSSSSLARYFSSFGVYTYSYTNGIHIKLITRLVEIQGSKAGHDA